MKIQIREGNTGILYLIRDDGMNERFIPDYDLKESNRLLQEFYKLKRNGTIIKDFFWKGGINWFPTTIAFLHWHILYMYVKYRAFFKKYPMEKYEYVFINKGRLSDFVSLILSYDDNRQEVSFFQLNFWKSRIKRWLTKQQYHRIIQLLYFFRLSFWKNRLKCWMSALYNKKIFRCYPQISVLLMRYGPTDFRTRYAKTILDDLGIKCIEFGSAGFCQLLKGLLQKNPRPKLLSSGKMTYYKRILFPLPEMIDPMFKRVLKAAVFAIQDKIYRFQAVYDFLKESLKDAPFKKLYGIDDTNYIYPTIYACQANGIKTIGHQHGSNYSPWDAPYNLKGFEEGEYRWFDKVLVWGEYWKNHILSNSSCYNKEQIKVGTHMRPLLRPLTADICGSSGTKNILIPYEYYADTYKIGQYICALQNLGYTIFFKCREDEKLEDQIAAYCLPEERQKQLIVVALITDRLMAKIDIVAGCCSTIIFDLIPYMKEIWILETKFVFGEYLVEEGIAKKIRLEHLEEDIHQPVKRIDKKLVDIIFSGKQLKDVLKQELLE